jgi:hypothetical protein
VAAPNIAFNFPYQATMFRVAWGCRRIPVVDSFPESWGSGRSKRGTLFGNFDSCLKVSALSGRLTTCESSNILNRSECMMVARFFGVVSHPHSRVEAVPNRAHGSSSDDVGINWSLSEIRLRVLPEINISFCTNNLKM